MLQGFSSYFSFCLADNIKYRKLSNQQTILDHFVGIRIRISVEDRNLKSVCFLKRTCKFS